MAGQLATPTVSDVRVIDNATGEVNADIGWTGQANSVDLASIRTRWMARTDGAASPAPAKATYSTWAESATLATQGDFQYIDTVETATNAQKAVSGTLSEDDERVTNAFFASKVIWVAARLEV